MRGGPGSRWRCSLGHALRDSVGRGRAGATPVRVPHHRAHRHRQGPLLLRQEQQLSPEREATQADYEVRARVVGLQRKYGEVMV